jgi:hypothetical protein
MAAVLGGQGQPQLREPVRSLGQEAVDDRRHQLLAGRGLELPKLVDVFRIERCPGWQSRVDGLAVEREPERGALRICGEAVIGDSCVPNRLATQESLVFLLPQPVIAKSLASSGLRRPPKRLRSVAKLLEVLV